MRNTSLPPVHSHPQLCRRALQFATAASALLHGCACQQLSATPLPTQKSSGLTSMRASDLPVIAHSADMASALLPAPLLTAPASSSLRPLITQTPL